MAAPTRNAFMALAGVSGTSYTASISTLRTGSLMGDCICLYMASDGNPTVSLAAQSITDGWQLVVQLNDATNAVKGFHLRYMVMEDGVAPDPIINLSASEAVSGHGIRIRPATGGAIIGMLTPTTAQGSSTNPNPASITNNTGGAKDIYYITSAAMDAITVTTAAPTNYNNHQTSTISNAANGSCTATADRTRTAVANAGAEDPGTFTKSTSDQWVTITTGYYEIVPDVLTSTNIAAGTPAISQSTLGQVHNATAGAVATSAPVITTAGIGQTHNINSTGVVTASPVISQSAFSSIANLNSQNIVGNAPAIAQSTFGQIHPFSAINITIGAPVISQATLADVPTATRVKVTWFELEATIVQLGSDNLIAADIETVSPAISIPAIGQTHVLAAANVNTPAAEVSVSGLAIIRALSALAVATAPVQLAAATLGQIHNAETQSVYTPVPAISQSSLTSRAVLTSLPVATSAVTISQSAIGQIYVNAAVDIETNSPAISTASLTQIHNVVSGNVATGTPNITAANIGQRHTLASLAIVGNTPAITLATVSEVGGLTSVNIVTGAPTISVPTMAQIHNLNTQTVKTNPPAIQLSALAQRQGMASQPIVTAAPAIGLSSLAEQHVLASTALTGGIPAISQATLLVASTIDNLVTTKVVTSAPVITLSTLGGVPDTPAERIINVPFENRLIIVGSAGAIDIEDRTINVPFENRTIIR